MCPPNQNSPDGFWFVIKYKIYASFNGPGRHAKSIVIFYYSNKLFQDPKKTLTI